MVGLIVISVNSQPVVFVSGTPVKRRSSCELRFGFSTLSWFDHLIAERTGMTCFFVGKNGKGDQSGPDY